MTGRCTKTAIPSVPATAMPPSPARNTNRSPAKRNGARRGAMIDSSPMYGQAEAVIGDLLRQTPSRARLFSATKIWTPSTAMGRWQWEQSRKLWGVPRFDLVHVHNMVGWQAHLETLREYKSAGKVRYIGITTSHGALHDEMAHALAKERF